MSDMAKRYGEYDATEKQVANSAIQQLKRWIDEASHLVFFGGAGVSTESGIPDFRGKNGLYRQGGVKVGTMTVGCSASDGEASSDSGNDALVDPEAESLGHTGEEPDFTLEEIFSRDVFDDTITPISEILIILVRQSPILPTVSWSNGSVRASFRR